MKRADTPHFANLRDGELMRVARRVTVFDILDNAAFIAVVAVVLFGVLSQ